MTSLVSKMGAVNRIGMKVLCFGIFAALIFLPGCLNEGKQEERVYTVYVELEPIANSPEANQNENSMQGSPRQRLTIEDNEKEDDSNPDGKNSTSRRKTKKKSKKIAVQNRLAALKKQMRDKGLLAEDLQNGVDRLQRIARHIQEKNYLASESMIEAFERDVAQIDIDKSFIDQKNDRLLERIQETNPSEEILDRIDAESEKINVLEEQANYIEINKHMNTLFKLLKSSH